MLLVALRHVCAHPLPSPFPAQTYELLLSCTTKETEEGTRNVISECLGKLVASAPSLWDALVANASHHDAWVRATIVSAVNYIPNANVSPFLALLSDPDIVFLL